MTAPLRMGVLGTGRITRKMGPAIARCPELQLVAVASREGDRAERWRGEFGAQRAYAGYERLLADPELEAVYIALPPALHREWTERAAERGLHVLCEKPLAVTAEDAGAMSAACEAAGVVLMDGVMWIHTPRAREMKRLIDDGTLGPIRRVTAAFTFHPDQWTADEHRLSPELGGGCLVDEGWYCVGAALWAFGSEPDEVIGRATRLASGVDVAFSGLLTFGGGPHGPTGTAGFDCGFQTAMRRWIEVAGEEGSLVCDDFTRPASPEKTRFWVHDRWGKSREVRCEPCDQEAALVSVFCRRCRGETTPSGEPSPLTVQRVCEALAAASQ